eukprot:631515-Pelagomonas_calceolata.AAC.1
MAPSFPTIHHVQSSDVFPFMNQNNNNNNNDNNNNNNNKLYPFLCELLLLCFAQHLGFTYRFYNALLCSNSTTLRKILQADVEMSSLSADLRIFGCLHRLGQ